MSDYDLFVVRHAIAFDEDRGQWPTDRDRPLTPEGEDAFRRAVRGLARLTGPVERVYSSPLTRAAQTAEILTKEADWPAPELLVELEPGSAATALVAALRVAAPPPTFAVVGHEPDLAALVAYLSGGKVELKKGGVARLSVPGFRRGAAELRWLLPPKALRAARP